MTPCCCWIPTHASQPRPPGELAPKRKQLAVPRGSPQGRLNFACSVKKLFALPGRLALLHFKVAVYVCLARLPGVLSLCPQIRHPPGCLLYSGHTVLSAHSLVFEGPDSPDCTRWVSAGIQVESEPQALSGTNANVKGLVLVLILGTFSQLEVLMHQGMEKKGKEKPWFREPEEASPLSSAPTKKL